MSESVRTYLYRIKIAGQPEKNWVDMFCMNLQKFDPVKISEPRSTPIQKDPYGFPDLENQAVTMIDVDFKYPATEPMIKQMARLLNYDENLVRMIQRNYDDSINQEASQYENEMKNSPILDEKEMSDNGKEAAKEYGEQYLPRIMKDFDKDRVEVKYAAPKTKDAVDTRKIQGNDKSPFSTITRQDRPATGASSGTKFR